MAACTTYSSIQVSGAGTSSVNGTYIPAGLSVNGNQVYTKDGNVSSWPKLYRPSGTGWAIHSNVPFPGASLYAESAGTVSDCPPFNTPWQITAFGVAPTPTVTGTLAPPVTPPMNTFGLPFTTVALITANFGTIENFLRLRNLGQV